MHRRFQDVAGIHRALGRAGPDQRVQLVQEHDNVPARAADFVHHALHALLELAAVLRAGDQPGQVERDNPFVGEQIRNIAVGDPLRQTFRDGSLPDARLANQAGIVLRAPAENLDHSREFLAPADGRIKLALTR